MGKVLGIDLGTTNSAMAIIEEGRARILPNAEGERTTPSVVSFLDEESYIVGSAAKARATEHPQLTVSSIKRLIGVPFEQREQERAALPYRTEHAGNGGTCVKIKTRDLTDAEIEERVRAKVAEDGARIGLYAPKIDLRIDGIDGREYSPEEISSFILGKLKADAETALGCPVEEAVITVPAYFDDAQRQATRKAGQLAGLKVLRIVSEPTAAALAYGVGSPELDERVLVFDLGGGTFDVSLLSIDHGVFSVLATAGDNHLGGDDWDQRLVDYLAAEFRERTGIDLRDDPVDYQRLRATADAAKIALSDAMETTVHLSAGDATLDLELGRGQFEGMTSPLRERVDRVLREIMRAVDEREMALDKVLLVGGSTRMPAIRELVAKRIGMEPDTSVNPDEAVALGAAVQGGLLTGEVGGISLHDVTPLSLGVETRGGLVATVIPRHAQIPTQRSQTFMTTEDGQTSVSIKVVQGERAIADDNTLLGSFRLEGIEPLPAGQAKIDVIFDIDANNIVTVVARDQLSGTENHVHISGAELDEAEVDRILKESEKHRAEDEELREEMSAEDGARVLVRTTRRAQSSYLSMLSSDENDAIRMRTNALADLVDEHAEPGEIEKAMERLREVRKPLEEIAEEARAAKAHGAGWTIEENAAPAIRETWEKRHETR